MTLESGQEGMERLSRLRKEAGQSCHQDPLGSQSTRSSVDSMRSPTTPASRSGASQLNEVPEDGTFAIGDEDDDDDDDSDGGFVDDGDDDDGHDERPTPAASESTPNSNIASRESSVAP